MNRETKDRLLRYFQSIATLAVDAQKVIEDGLPEPVADTIEYIQGDVKKIVDILEVEMEG